MDDKGKKELLSFQSKKPALDVGVWKFGRAIVPNLSDRVKKERVNPADAQRSMVAAEKIGIKAMPVYMAALESSNTKFKKEALNSALRLGSDMIPVFEAALKDPSSEVVFQALNSAANLDERRLYVFLKTYDLYNHSTYTRAMTDYAFARKSDGIPIFRKALKHKDPSVALYAIRKARDNGPEGLSYIAEALGMGDNLSLIHI